MTSDADAATGYYGQMVNELGRRLLELEEERRVARIEATVARQIVELVVQSRRMSLSPLSLEEAIGEVLANISRIMLCDFVYMLSWFPAEKSFTVLYTWGRPADVGIEITLESPPPAFACTDHSDAVPVIQVLQNLSGASNVAFAYVGSEKYAIALFRKHTSNVQMPFGEADREVIGMALQAVNDLVRERAVQRELIEAKNLSETANKEKTEFLSMMTHELRTPLNVIIGYADLVSYEIGQKQLERVADHIEQINGSARHLLQLVNSILDIGKIDAGKIFDQLTIIDPGAIVVSELRRMDALIQRTSVQPDLRIEADCRIISEERMLRQIIMNLLSNAIKFSPRGGRLSVSIGRVEGGVKISIADEGIGIRPEDLPRVMEPFFQVDRGYGRQFEGTGLGLTIVKKLMDAHGGRLQVESDYGVGTNVSLLFPSADERQTDGLPIRGNT